MHGNIHANSVLRWASYAIPSDFIITTIYDYRVSRTMYNCTHVWTDEDVLWIQIHIENVFLM
jgi:hypothetical protein